MLQPASCGDCAERRIRRGTPELGLAYTVVRANKPLLEVANSPIGKWNGGLRTFSQLRAERLDASDMFKAGLNET